MALIQCPDCGRNVSDRAKNCPDCACPVAEVIAETREAESREANAASRVVLEGREVDCGRCGGRGWFRLPDNLVAWCIVCEHTGRTPLARADDGYYSVAPYALERFLSGELHPETSGIVYRLGTSEPTSFAFPEACDRVEVDPNDPMIPWTMDAEERKKLDH